MTAWLQAKNTLKRFRRIGLMAERFGHPGSGHDDSFRPNISFELFVGQSQQRLNSVSGPKESPLYREVANFLFGTRNAGIVEEGESESEGLGEVGG